MKYQIKIEKDAQKFLKKLPRRKLNKLGYTMKKTNCRRNSIDNFGGYAIIDTACNAIVRGSRFDLDLDDIDQFISEFK